LCVVIPCSFTAGFTARHAVWYQCQETKDRCGDVDIIFHTNNNNRKGQPGFRGRVSLLEPDVTQRNCSIVINDLKESDSGAYQFRKCKRSRLCFTFLVCLSFCIALPEELTAEAGLCVVIPCFFTAGFTARHAVWYQCQETKDRCGDVDIIFHTNNNNRKGQPGFRGRVSLLEPDVRQRICSIVINDLKESDSGAYQFRVIGTRDSDRYQFLQKVLISVKGLSQKPTVEIPPLTEGREATLTCTAPGLCSGSAPEFLWTWSGAGGSISGNITTLTDRLNAIANRYSSTLTFNPSAEHHGTNITCTVRLTDDRTTEETVTLNVSYVKDLRIIGETAVKEHETLNLTCSVDSFPPSRITWIKLSDLFLQNGTETVVQNDTSAELLNETETSEQEDAVYLDSAATEYADVTVTCKSTQLKMSECDICVHQLIKTSCRCLQTSIRAPDVSFDQMF
uniref:Ig-like domain-containing protein n=1 Tax=Salarias fasciatus TaxID=181472 RepID=A0A672FIA2_SALFA